MIWYSLSRVREVFVHQSQGNELQRDQLVLEEISWLVSYSLDLVMDRMVVVLHTFRVGI